MNRSSLATLTKACICLIAVCIIAIVIHARIVSVNAEATDGLAASEFHGVKALHTRHIEALPWGMPESSGMIPGYYDGIAITDIGTLTIEDYSTFISHVDLPADYLAFDKQGTVSYATLPITLENASDAEVLVQFPDFWLMCGIVPASCAQGLLPQFNQDVSAVIKPGEESSFTAVYRILHNGFPSDYDWESLPQESFQLVIPAYPDKYTFDLSTE